MKNEVMASLVRRAELEFGDQLPEEFEKIVDFLNDQIELEKSDDDVAVIYLEWLTDLGLHRGHEEYLRALKLAYRVFPDPISATAIANALSHVPGSEMEAVGWSDRSIQDAKSEGRLIRYALAARVRLLIRLEYFQEAASSFRELIAIGPRSEGDDDVNLPLDLAELPLLDTLEGGDVISYRALLE